MKRQKGIMVNFANLMAQPDSPQLSGTKERIKSALEDLVKYCHGQARAMGWYTDLKTGAEVELNVGMRIALMHSELSEAFEAHRKNKVDDHLPHRPGLEVELADTVIRIFDFCGAEDIDIAGAIFEKMAYNRNRADHKVENRRICAYLSDCVLVL